MSDWMITITAVEGDPASAEDLVDALPGAAVSIGADRLSVSFTVDAGDVDQALEAGLAAWRQASPGLEPLRVEVSAGDLVDEELERPGFPALLGVSELAERLGVSKARASELARAPSFPRPVAQLASGPVWTEPSVSGHLEGWERKPGRPSKLIQEVHRLQTEIRRLHDEMPSFIDEPKAHHAQWKQIIELEARRDELMPPAVEPLPAHEV